MRVHTQWALTAAALVALSLASCEQSTVGPDDGPGTADPGAPTDPGAPQDPGTSDPGGPTEPSAPEPPAPVVIDDPIELSGNDTLEIVDAHYILRNDVRLRDRAVLIVRNSLIEHAKEYTFQYSVEASGESKVILEDARIANPCNGSLNWNFLDSARLESDGVEQEQCNVWFFFTNTATARIRDHHFNGTFCDESSGDIEGGMGMEVELCWEEGAVVDETLPVAIDEFHFPNENDRNITFDLTIRNSTIDGWGIGVQPNTDITIRDSPRLTIAIIVGLPYRDRTVTVEDLRAKTYEDTTWEIADSRLRLINSATYGWEANAFCCNTIIVRNSDYAASNINSGDAVYEIEDSTVGDLGAQERVTMTVRNSRVRSNVVASDDATIRLIDTVVEGKIVEEGNGRVLVE